MSSSANVRSIRALEDLRSELARFSSEASDALNQTDREIVRTLNMLGELERRWKTKVRAWEEEVRKRQARLDSCLAAAGDSAAALMCIPLEKALNDARTQLASARASLRDIQMRIHLVQEAAAAYQHRARPLRMLLSNEVPKATAQLGRSSDILRSYTTGGMMPVPVSLAPPQAGSASTGSISSGQCSVGAAPPFLAPERFPDRSFQDAHGHDLLLLTHLSGDECYVRVHDLSKTPDVPRDHPTFGNVGRANLRFERDHGGRVIRTRLQDLETLKPYQEAGVGSHLLEHVEAVSRAYGAGEVYGSAPDDHPTRNWYTHRGYVFRDDRREIYKTLS
jgi:GNAT superfamily N-acetyltransferase